MLSRYHCITQEEECLDGFTSSSTASATFRHLGLCGTLESGCLADDALSRSEGTLSTADQCMPAADMTMADRLMVRAASTLNCACCTVHTAWGGGVVSQRRAGLLS